MVRGRRNTGLASAVLLVGLISGCAMPFQPSGPVAPVLPSSTVVPHVFIIMMENQDEDLIGSADAPRLTALAHQYGQPTNYYGVTHPSLPNYVASIAGDYFGTHSDSPSQRFDGPSIVNQLAAHGRSWKAYMESLPRPGFTGDYAPAASPLYARKHDPFMLMTEVLRRPAWRSRVVPLSQLGTDLRRNRVPNLAYIAPNLCHDMHGASACSSSNLVAVGDKYASSLVRSIMSSTAWRDDATIFVIWDEAETTSIAGCCAGAFLGGGRVPAIVIARQGVRHYTSSRAYNHYSLLRTLQVVWHLGCLRHTCDRSVQPMTEFLQKVKK